VSAGQKKIRVRFLDILTVLKPGCWGWQDVKFSKASQLFYQSWKKTVIPRDMLKTD
jgi:hypothetical protein